MKGLLPAAMIVAALAAGSLPLAADVARFRHLVSVYVDDKGAGLHLPEGVACDDTGTIVIGDTGNDRLVRFTYQDRTLTGGVEIRIPQLVAPTRVHLNSKGDIYALDGRQRRVVHLGPTGAFKAVVAFDGAPPPSTIVPKSFTIDAADNIYVLDALSARVLVLDAAGRFQRAMALPDDIGFVTDLAVDTQGRVLAVDALRRRLLAATGDAAFAVLGGDLTDTLVTMPTHLAAGRGVMFVVEGSGGNIVSFGQDGSFLARQLTPGWKEGALNHPSQMCINGNNEAFIADRDNSRVQVFALTR